MHVRHEGSLPDASAVYAVSVCLLRSLARCSELGVFQVSVTRFSIRGFCSRQVASVLLVGATILGLGSCGELVGEVHVLRSEPSDGGLGPTEVGDPREQAECRGGAARCQGPVLQHCELDGSGWRSLERCASAALCVAAEGEVSRCMEPACEAGLSCDGSVLRQCAVDQTGYEALDTCLSAAHCDPSQGACQDAPCVAGELSCNGASLRRCNGTPTGHDQLATCVTAALCGDLLRAACGENLASCDLEQPACPPPACEVGELRCAGPRLESCNAGRNGWDFVDECVTAGVCELTRQNPVAVSCVEPLCGPGDTVCSAAGAILACSLDQTEYVTPVAQCRSADFCTPGGCEADPCTPGALSCNGSVLQLCQESPDGSSLSRVAVSDCQTQQLCQATLTQGAGTPPACLPPACAAGELRCAGRQMQACNAGRTDFVNRELCATDGLCQAGVGLGVCPTPCSGSTCNGSILRGCNADFTALIDLENCGTAAECNSVAGTCDDPCVAGQRRCNGAALEECESPLEGWQRLETCETGQLCELTLNANRTTCESPRCAPGQRRCTGQALEVCNVGLTGFLTERTCTAGQVCDAVNQQCDVCVAGSVDCEGDLFLRCSANGQLQSEQQCGAGLCSSAGNNVGCLSCPTANAFRCDNQGSLFQCSANQRLETQVDVCRTPQLCRAELGKCLGCDTPGSSRCNGAQVLTCSSENTESVSATCATAALCQTNGSTAACQDRACLPGALECTAGGEVLLCNAAQTGYRQQSPRVTCESPALCDVSAPGGCRPRTCQSGERRCNGDIVEVCNDDLTAFRVETDCNDRLFCNGAETCNPATRACQAGAAPCANDGSFCSGTEGCSEGTDSCTSTGSPCGAGQICSDALGQCVQCVGDPDCAPGQSCVANACVGGTLDGGT